MSKKLSVTKITPDEIKLSEAELDAQLEGVSPKEKEDEMSKEDEAEDKTEDETNDKEDKKYFMKKESLEEFKKLVAEQKDIPLEFASKMATMFEAVVNETIESSVKEIVAEMKIDQEKFEETVLEDVSQKADQFLEKVVSEWKDENKAILESKIKVEKADKFLEGLKSLFIENYVEIEDEKKDLFQESEQKIASLEEKLDAEIAKNLSLQEKINHGEREAVISEMTKDCSDTEVLRLKSLLENMTIKNNDDLKVKVGELLETVCKTQETIKPITEMVTDIVQSKTKLTLDESLNLAINKIKQEK